jgi:hypothetical protein
LRAIKIPPVEQRKVNPICSLIFAAAAAAATADDDDDDDDDDAVAFSGKNIAAGRRFTGKSATRVSA